jgi:hypothetical protein
MSVKEEVVFICQVRYGGAKGSSIIVTIPTEIVGLMKLKHRDYVRIKVKKIKPEDL